ncbi:MAG: PLP-dependent cysteine synthase family protein [Planctomycetota bacterium]
MNWVHHAVRQIESDFNRSADTHLIKLPFCGTDTVQVFLKDESSHPSGSLKHRLARSLFLYALCNGWIQEGTPIVEASSGSTAISEAYFARLLGLPYHTVIPAQTSKRKIKEIEFLGGKCHLVESSQIYTRASELTQELGGCYLDQFTYAERATDWRGNNNIAESLFRQLEMEPNPIPTWVVVGAGTGGTSATIGRYIRYFSLDTKLCVADPENSVYAEYFRCRDSKLTCPRPSRIEGIGRPRVEPSFIPSVIDRVIEVPDSASIACMQFLEQFIGRRCGPSTGTNLWAVFQLVSEMKARGERGNVVSLICDGGERYLETHYCDSWLASQQLDPTPYRQAIEQFQATGELSVDA